jgi:membrane protease YdiL (CAAX protease family)
VSDRPDEPVPPQPDPWARPSGPGEPDAPSWAGPWSEQQPEPSARPEAPDEPEVPPHGERQPAWRDGRGNGWGSRLDQDQRRGDGSGWQATTPPPGGPPPGRPERQPLPPAPATPRVLWLELALVLVLAFAPGALSLLVLAAGAGAQGNGTEQLTPAIVSGLFSAFLSWSPVLLIAYLVIRSGEGMRGIGLGRFDPRADGVVGLGLWVASFVLVLILAWIFSPLGQREVDFLPTELPLWFRWVDALVIAGTAGITEEVVVRGYAQTRLEQLKAPTAVILLLPTALWGVLHLYQGASAALTIFCLGMLYAWYFYRTRRLWPLIIAHGLFDLTQLVLLLAGTSR